MYYCVKYTYMYYFVKYTYMYYFVKYTHSVLALIFFIARKPNLEKFSIYSNKFFHNFHLSKSSFTCPRLWESGLELKKKNQPQNIHENVNKRFHNIRKLTFCEHFWGKISEASPDTTVRQSKNSRLYIPRNSSKLIPAMRYKTCIHFVHTSLTMSCIISDDTSVWCTHITTVKEQAYKSLVRPSLEYACSVWDPITMENITQLKQVQRRAARYVTNRYHNTSKKHNSTRTGTT
jgi:hypothetical protein